MMAATEAEQLQAAFTSAMATVFEVLIASDSVRAAVLAQMLADQRDGLLAKELPVAAGLIELMRATIVARKAERETLHALLQGSTEGRA